ncbi:MAG: PhoH family protein [Planctomycetes bacterium]|nr:PhoH family protein [Planctomycetota bacterium]
MRKTFILDTNVLLHNASSVESFADNQVVIPMAVIEELDRFKTHSDERGRNARAVIRRIDALRAKGSLREGVPMENSGILKILTGGGSMKELGLEEDLPDNRIIRLAYYLKQDGENVIFVSKDINARLKADALGIVAQDFEKQKVRFDELFNGYQEVDVPAQMVDDFYKQDKFPFPKPETFPNEFVLLKDETNPKHTALGRATRDGVGKNNGLNSAEGRDPVLLHLNPHSDHAWNIKPRSKEQRMALELLLDPAVRLVTLVGKAGTGKTLLAIAAALETTLRQQQYDKILISRPIIPLGKDIGFLPGSKDEKLTHWMQPIFDNLAYLMQEKDKEGAGQKVDKKIEDLQSKHQIELEALTYIRGRSLSNQYVIVDEAQNLTPHEVKTVVSRCGEGTKMVLTGDPYQIDNPYLDASSNGLSYAVERLKGEMLHGHITLYKAERSPLAEIAAELL